MRHSEVEGNKTVARDLLAAIAAGDFETIERLIDPACAWWVQGWGMVDRGSFVASLGATIRRATSRKFEILFVTAEEDRVAIAAEGAFQFPEGDYCNSYHYLFTVENGRIVAAREYLDTMIAARFYAPRS